MRTLFQIAPGCLGALALAVTGCGDDGTSAGSDGRDLASTSVSGTLTDTYVTEGGDIEQPVDPSLVAVAALLPGNGAGAPLINGTIQDDGTFSIPDVPEGTYYLGFAQGSFLEFIVTSARSFDLGFVFAGRPEAAQVLTNPTNLVFNVDQLSPWQSGDQLEMFSLGARTYGELISVAENPPGVGATALTGMSSNAFLFYAPWLVDGDLGDKAVITQLTTRQTGGSGAPLPYNAITKAFKPGPFVQSDGQTTELTGSFEDAPQSDVTIDWRRSGWSAAIKDAHPSAEVVSHNISAYSEPGGAARATSSLSPTLLGVTDTESTDVTLSMGYGNPFPSGWAPVGNVFTIYAIPVALPGSGETKLLGLSMGASAPIDALFGGPIEPTITPVRDIQINGKPAYDTMTGVGDAPTVSFSPPAKGTPSAYAILVRQVDPTSTPIAATVAVVRTADTTVTIPAGVLAKGSYYYLQIACEIGRDLTAPHKVTPTAAYAEAATGFFAP